MAGTKKQLRLGDWEAGGIMSLLVGPLPCDCLRASRVLGSKLLHEVSQLLHALQRHAAGQERGRSRKIE